MTPLRTIGNDFVYKRELPRKQTFENSVLSTEPKFVQKNVKTLIMRMVAKTCQLSEKKKPEKDENCLLLSIIIYSQRVK